MNVDPVAAANLLLNILEFGREVFTSSKVSKAEKQKIAKEAEQLVQLARMSDIDTELRIVRSKGAPVRKAAMKKSAPHLRKLAVKKASAKRAPARRTKSDRRG